MLCTTSLNNTRDLLLDAEQIKRVPRSFPKLVWKRDVHDIDDFCYDDFEVQGYKPHPKIDMKMSV